MSLAITTIQENLAMQTFCMPNSTLETITSLATTYAYLDEDLIDEILVKEPNQPDIIRAASALRIARRALGTSIVDPISLQFSKAEMAAEDCKILQDQLGEMMVLSPAAKAKSYSRLLHSYAVNVYTIAARIAFLLSKEKSSPFK